MVNPDIESRVILIGFKFLMDPETSMAYERILKYNWVVFFFIPQKNQQVFPGYLHLA